MEVKKIKIIIVDDNKIFREGLKFYLEDIKQYEIIEMAEDGLDFLNLKNINLADIILMDVEMPNLNGIQAAKKVLENLENLKIIAITGYQNKLYLTELIETGFKGCVLKKNIYSQISKAITQVKNGSLFFPASINI